MIHLYSDLFSFHYNNTKRLRWTSIIPHAFPVQMVQILTNILTPQVIKGDVHPFLPYYPTTKAGLTLVP